GGRPAAEPPVVRQRRDERGPGPDRVPSQRRRERVVADERRAAEPAPAAQGHGENVAASSRRPAAEPRQPATHTRPVEQGGHALGEWEERRLAIRLERERAGPSGLEEHGGAEVVTVLRVVRAEDARDARAGRETPGRPCA